MLLHTREQRPVMESHLPALYANRRVIFNMLGQKECLLHKKFNNLKYFLKFTRMPKLTTSTLHMQL